MIALSVRGGGRQGSDGGCRRAEVYMYVGETDRDVMRLKEWEQESRGEKGSVGLGDQSRLSQRLLLCIPP